jgi:hypothetical protein
MGTEARWMIFWEVIGCLALAVLIALLWVRPEPLPLVVLYGLEGLAALGVGTSLWLWQQRLIGRRWGRELAFWIGFSVVAGLAAYGLARAAEPAVAALLARGGNPTNLATSLAYLLVGVPAMLLAEVAILSVRQRRRTSGGKIA